MKEHPIEGLMLTAMESIRSMIDVNTIIGEPIIISNGISVIPISKVSFGLAAGGSEFATEIMAGYSKKQDNEEIQYNLPFGGGSGVGASISPIAFIVAQNNTVRLMPVEHTNGFDKLLDYIPDIVEKVNNYFNKKSENNFDKKSENNIETF